LKGAGGLWAARIYDEINAASSRKDV